jgi:aldose sugar dehydrogenase
MRNTAHMMGRAGEDQTGRTRRPRRCLAAAGMLLGALCAVLPLGKNHQAQAQVAPMVLDPNLAVRTVVAGLSQPTTMAFIGPDDLLVLEKGTGQVKRVKDGVVAAVLDLAVNSGSERGLLGIALHPRFPENPGVYLYWTESSTGSDTSVLSETPLLGNRVDRFAWDGNSLTFDFNLIRIRAIQEDTGQPARGNHDGGVLAFGPDGKLHIIIGDLGRRGQMQNLPDGPGFLTPPAPGAIPRGNLPDDQFGGPEPDNAHMTGVILRLNDDGSAPADNPFFRAGQNRGGEAGENLKKIFAYGVRNSFGLAFDPKSGNLWDQQNGDDTFSELNLVEPGSNLGWVQVMGPIARIAQHKEMETSQGGASLQQLRWPPTLLADTPAEVRERLFMVYEEGDRFAAGLEGRQEVPSAATGATGRAEIELQSDGTLRYRLRIANITGLTASHIHLGARGQNGPVVAFLFGPDPGRNISAEETVAEGIIDDDDVSAQPGFDGTVATLVQRMRQGRAYVNAHTLARPGGEIRGAILVTDAAPVSHYSDPEFSWKWEVAPAGIGFLNSRALGPQYEGDLFTAAARNFLEGGQLFHFNLAGNRRKIGVDDPRLEDRVADNLFKFDITESESLLFGRNFGIGTDIETSPSGTLYVVSLSSGAIYEIYRTRGRPR